MLFCTFFSLDGTFPAKKLVTSVLMITAQAKEITKQIEIDSIDKFSSFTFIL